MLVTVPDTVTLPLGVAYVGLIDVIVIDIGWAGPACPRPARPALDAAAGATERAAADHPGGQGDQGMPRGSPARGAAARAVPGPGRAPATGCAALTRHAEMLFRPAGCGPHEDMSRCRRPYRFPPGTPTPYPRCPCQTPTT